MWESTVVEPEKTADACFMMLHGLGASALELSTIASELGVCHMALRYLFPQAPQRSVTVNGGMVMPAWYDIFAIASNAPQDIAGIYQSEKILASLIDQQVASGISSDRIVLGGFSQGGALALHTALRYPKRLGGVLGFSTYLPVMERLKTERSAFSKGLPIVLYHGTFDPVVPLSMARASYTALEQLDIYFDWLTYPIPHTVSTQQIHHAKAWIKEKIG